ncbi:MAG: polysaccharide biosynthesis C-terminal domain-containing protein [Bacteroidales bacterium]|nr:polysaccharide biosynthesis C-terminal domain-containing protein [Bacteroidales bacterium]
MKRKFVTNLALLLFLNLLIKPFYVLGIDVGIQNAVTAASYGIYFPLLSLSLMFQVVLDMGIENFTRREIARHQNSLSRYLSNILVIRIFLGLIYFVLCLVIGIIWNYNLYQIRLLSILLFNQFLASLILYLRANIGGMHLFKTESIISVLDKTLLIIICGTLLWGNVTKHAFKIEWFIYAQTFAYFITLLVSLTVVLTKAGRLKLNIEIRDYLSIIKKSLPYALLIFLMASYYRIDSILLERMLPEGRIQAGIYAHSFRLLDMLQNYGYLFALILLPMFARMLKNRESVEQLVHIAYVLIIIPAIMLSVASVAYGNELISLLYNEHLMLSSRVFRTIMPGFLGICSTYIFGCLLTANGNLKILNIIAGAGALISLILNLILIPRIGVLGSAIANLLAQLLTAFTQVIVATIIFKFSINHKLIIQLLIYSSVIILMVILVRRIPISWFYQLVFFALASIVFAFVLKIIDLNSMYRLIRSGDQVS